MCAAQHDLPEASQIRNASGVRRKARLGDSRSFANHQRCRRILSKKYIVAVLSPPVWRSSFFELVGERGCLTPH
jgi:hypothetical protein